LNTIDAIILIAVLIGFILGFKDGFVRKLIGIIGFILAIVAAVFLANGFGEMIEDAFGIELYLAEIVGGVAVFFLVTIIFTLLKRIVHPFEKVNNLINQIAGGMVGSFQILFFLSSLFLIMNIFDFPDNTARNRSVFYNPTSKILPATIDYLSSYTPQTKQIIKDYIEQKDTLK
jgi:membrane protein required for colicin V production